MKNIFNGLVLFYFLLGVSNAAPSLMEGEFVFYDYYGDARSALSGSYSGEIDLTNQTGSLQSNQPFSGYNWTANITKIFVYDEAVGGDQSFSWDVSKQIWFDFGGYIIECYVEGNG